MKRFFFCLLLAISFAAFTICFYGCGAEEDTGEQSPDAEVEKQDRMEEEGEDTGKGKEKAADLGVDPSSGSKGMKEATEGEGE
jgi:hypothetical protein